MEISDVRVRLINDGNDRLKAVCTVTFDDQFVVRDVKVVEGATGLFVAMPSRKVSVHCQECGFKNAVRSRFCNECGAKLPPSEVPEVDDGRTRMHRDIAHPITTPFRERLQAEVLKAFEAERAAPGQRSRREPSSDDQGVEDHEDRHEGPQEETEELSEYDAIIAGLRSGLRPGSGPARRESGPQRSRDDAGSRPRGPDRSQGHGGGRGGDRGRRSEGRSQPPRDGGRPRRGDEAGSRGESRPRPVETRRSRDESTPVRSNEASRPAVESTSAEGFGAGLLETATSKPARPAPAERPATPRKPEVPPPPAADDEGGSFGEGIL